jgi:hypothetical protein
MVLGEGATRRRRRKENHMSDLVVTHPAPRSLRRRRIDRGAVSAEYALLTVGTITFGGVLLKIITDEAMRNQLLQIILAIIKFLLSNFGAFAG